MGDEQGQRRRGRPRALEADAIIEAAIAMIDSEGLEGLTMRKLGRRLGVDPTAPYRTFESRSALLAAVVDRVADELHPLPPGPADPTELLIHVALHYRRVLLQHPNLAPLVAARPLRHDDWFTPAKLGVALFSELGFDEQTLPQVIEAVLTFMLGYVVHETGRRRLLAELGETDATRTARLDEGIERFGGPDSLIGRVLSFQRAIDEAVAERTYELGMRALIEGLRVPGTDRSTPEP